MQPEQGDYYLSFVVLITILEKALYDLHHAEQARHRAASEGKKNMILRDLLQSDTLNALLPAGLMQLLKVLFLPSGLNLRNLVWHGFIIPADFPRCWSSLTILLLLELPRYFAADAAGAMSSVLFQSVKWDAKFVIKELQQASISSSFIPVGRRNLILKGCEALLERRDEPTFLFCVLPVLEHAIRVAFVRINQAEYGDKQIASAYAEAQIDAYYSTLDGFGQREKHQVLLHPVLHSDHIPCPASDDLTKTEEVATNALYSHFPLSALSVCLDLFMMAAGPNLRAKLCHGEADLSNFQVDLCQQKTDVVIPSYTSSFHPFFLLERDLECLQDEVVMFDSSCERWAEYECQVVSVEAGLMSINFGNGITITDTVGRIEDLFHVSSMNVGGGENRKMTSGKKPKSFGYLVREVDRVLEECEARLGDHFQDCHRHNRSVFLGSNVRVVVLQADGARCGDAKRISDWRSDVGIRALLSLGDTDGLSVAGCMIEIISSTRRSLATFQAKIHYLHNLVLIGQARTNHRRSLLVAVFFMPIFQRILMFCAACVEHQYVELIAKATEDEASCTQSLLFGRLQTKLLQFVTAFEGCTGSSEASQKSGDKAVQLALQFLRSKPVQRALVQ
ncbi:TPA: hypothetical protein N0F65_005076 [Lagenidium giganteum]|uniref:DUF4209 domain-containing protein n=1 Tax=Lagenidium giganteum TaxID=4803 RepID=A0AAV2YIR9_9STRA|nr:TPA: hypothetical protein N0F65_005076 [Lagenidium giganteum]